MSRWKSSFLFVFYTLLSIACQGGQISQEPTTEKVGSDATGTLDLVEAHSTTEVDGGSEKDQVPEKDPEQQPEQEAGESLHEQTPEKSIGSIKWNPCPIQTGQAQPKGAECATVQVPLNYDEAKGKKIQFFVKRIRAISQSRGQLWLLHGGLVGWGVDMEAFAKIVAKAHPDLDLYLPDHRGSGRSQRWSCPIQEEKNSEGGFYLVPSEVEACEKHIQKTIGKDRVFYTTTAAARDLDFVIQRTRKPGEQLLMYGVSYGTFWLHRYIQIFPKEPTGTIFDSICFHKTCQMDKYDQWVEDLGKKVLGECGKDPVCGKKLGTAPWKRVIDILDKYDKGACPAMHGYKITRSQLRSFAGAILKNWWLRLAVGPFFYRLERCSVQDIQAISYFINNVVNKKPSFPPPPSKKSAILGLQIVRSELLSKPLPSAEELKKKDKSYIIADRVGLLSAEAIEHIKPVPPDTYVGKTAKTSIPMLMMNGSMDPQTPLEPARAMEKAFTGPFQTFVAIPYAAHGVVAQSPLQINTSQHCGMIVFNQFVKNPKQKLDTSCINKLLAPNYGGSAAIAKYMFNTADFWD